jgi:hypothetical protein
MSELESWILCAAWFLAGIGIGTAIGMAWMIRKLKKLVLYLEGYYQRNKPKIAEIYEQK